MYLSLSLWKAMEEHQSPNLTPTNVPLTRSRTNCTASTLYVYSTQWHKNQKGQSSKFMEIFFYNSSMNPEALLEKTRLVIKMAESTISKIYICTWVETLLACLCILELQVATIARDGQKYPRIASCKNCNWSTITLQKSWTNKAAPSITQVPAHKDWQIDWQTKHRKTTFYWCTCLRNL